MWTTFASIFLTLLGVYLLIGLLFAIPFVLRLVTQIDEAAQGTGWGFRLLIFPGTIALWPVLLKKWFKKGKP